MVEYFDIRRLYPAGAERGDPEATDLPRADKEI